VLVGPVRVDQQSGKLYKIIMLKIVRKRQQQRYQKSTIWCL
jgi:hypothetical protein